MIQVKELSCTVCLKSCEAFSKPPVCCSGVVSSTAKGRIYVFIMAKIIFFICGIRRSIELTNLMIAGNMEKIFYFILIPWCGTIAALMTTDIHIFYCLAITGSHKIYDVQIREFSSDVIAIVDTMCWKAAGRSPVGGLGTKIVHHAQTHSVCVPVW